ncbi:hypothetical protein T440DRAFT_512419 [Plenodomus tracheiphilus IPT5]|uniref:PRISE-like Rossmann-fold domain-containing protein n=1 Tax=Plenodomus tracheiphilus IPT5 TaxID=1408161 RepID=A0A6A7ANY8_9PLEO|nr:hypothetical protein T440DRAFT_512419 [Plenodomus tracheiphilus IPT5]
MPLPKSKVAFVTGANGISGNAIIEHLIRQPRGEWSRIVVTSRNAPSNYWEDPRVEFIELDFLSPVEDLISRMTPICNDVTHAYFTSYVHVDEFNKLKDSNVALFENFLTTIDTVAGTSLQRVCLQTGVKHYGCHLGPTPAPMSEEHPRYDDKGLNFYYIQEDLLFTLHKKRQWSWNVIRPSAIVGFTPARSGMAQGLSVALYFVICRELGEKPVFPGNKFSWTVAENQSSAAGLADMTIWATTQPHTANEAFNHADGDIYCYRDLFPRIGAYFGVQVEEPKFAARGESFKYIENEFALKEWAEDKQPVWELITKKYGGKPEAFGWGTWRVMDWALGKSWSAATSISKARKFGWTRYDDTWDNWVDTIRAFENAGILPRLPVLGNRANYYDA